MDFDAPHRVWGPGADRTAASDLSRTPAHRLVGPRIRP